MVVVIFEDERWSDFAPVSAIRHVSLLKWGTRSICDSARALAGTKEVVLWGRAELSAVAAEAGETGYNSSVTGETLFVSARARLDGGLRRLFERTGRFVARCGGSVVAARLDPGLMAPGAVDEARLLKAARGLDVLELPEGSVFRGCWHLVMSNGMAIVDQARVFSDQLKLPDGTGIKGPASNIMIHGSAEVEQHVTFDGRLGPVVVDEGASIESFSRVSGPCYVGPRTRVHSALVREGTSIFEGCRIGGEVENSIILPHTNKSHGGYVGHSVVGEWVNLGAGSVFSNLKNTYGSVRADIGGKRVDTGETKFGPVIGDMAKVSIATAIYAGKTIGVASQVAGLVDRSVPGFTFYGGQDGRMVELRLESVLDTQARMKERRGLVLSKAEEELIRRAFASTRKERVAARVRKGKIG